MSTLSGLHPGIKLFVWGFFVDVSPTCYITVKKQNKKKATKNYHALSPEGFNTEIAIAKGKQ